MPNLVPNGAQLMIAQLVDQRYRFTTNLCPNGTVESLIAQMEPKW